MKKTVYECDRCGLKESVKIASINISIPNGEDNLDLCPPCYTALLKWLSKDNATTPGGRGPGWEEQCHHRVPCAGPCADPSWKKVR